MITHLLCDLFITHTAQIQTTGTSISTSVTKCADRDRLTICTSNCVTLSIDKLTRTIHSSNTRCRDEVARTIAQHLTISTNHIAVGIGCIIERLCRRVSLTATPANTSTMLATKCRGIGCNSLTICISNRLTIGTKQITVRINTADISSGKWLTIFTSKHLTISTDKLAIAIGLRNVINTQRLTVFAICVVRTITIDHVAISINRHVTTSVFTGSINTITVETCRLYDIGISATFTEIATKAGSAFAVKNTTTQRGTKTKQTGSTSTLRGIRPAEATAVTTGTTLATAKGSVVLTTRCTTGCTTIVIATIKGARSEGKTRSRTKGTTHTRTTARGTATDTGIQELVDHARCSLVKGCNKRTAHLHRHEGEDQHARGCEQGNQDRSSHTVLRPNICTYSSSSTQQAHTCIPLTGEQRNQRGLQNSRHSNQQLLDHTEHKHRTDDLKDHSHRVHNHLCNTSDETDQSKWHSSNELECALNAAHHHRNRIEDADQSKAHQQRECREPVHQTQRTRTNGVDRAVQTTRGVRNRILGRVHQRLLGVKGGVEVVVQGQRGHIACRNGVWGNILDFASTIFTSLTEVTIQKFLQRITTRTIRRNLSGSKLHLIRRTLCSIMQTSLRTSTSSSLNEWVWRLFKSLLFHHLQLLDSLPIVDPAHW